MVELAAQAACLSVHVKLKEGVTGRQCHLIQFAWVPGRDDVASALGLGLDLLDNLVDLVERGPIWPAPVAPLSTVDPTEIALVIRPFIPNGHLIVV